MSKRPMPSARTARVILRTVSGDPMYNEPCSISRLYWHG